MPLVLRRVRLVAEQVVSVVGVVDGGVGLRAVSRVCLNSIITSTLFMIFVRFILRECWGCFFVANPPHTAFRDRDAGAMSNRGKPTDDGNREDRHSNQARGGRGGFEGRGGRGARGGRGGRGGGRDDRHNRGPPKYPPPPLLLFFFLGNCFNAMTDRES